MSYLIGVDSGGTHVVATSYTKDKQKIHSATMGPGNIFIDPQQTVTNISKAVIRVAQKDECSKILIGMAGFETAKNIDKYLEKIKYNLKGISQNIIFTSDAKLALISNLEGKDGFLVIAGTGSIVYGKQHGKFLRAGGWGPLLDDFGSAYKISQEAIMEILKDYDLGKSNRLSSTALKFFKQKSIPDLASIFYNLDRATISSFAKQIGLEAQKGDQKAKNILLKQTDLLTDEIIGLIRRYKNSDVNQTLALSGSVLVNNQIVQKTIKKNIFKEYPKMKIIISNKNNNAAVNYI